MKNFKMLLLSALAVLGLTMCTSEKNVEDNTVYDVTPVMPEFPGGTEALFEFLSENVKYPEKAEELGIEGRVVCTFIVEKDGSIDSVKVVQSVDSILDNEAVRVISAMPDWIAGTDTAGNALRVRYTVPITFRFEGRVEEKVDKAPEFPGGTDALFKFLSENVTYPVEAEQARVQGRVLVEVVIDENGNVTNPVISKSVDPLLDKEALRVVKLMPKWTPGENGGKAVRVKYTVPFTFRLE